MKTEYKSTMGVLQMWMSVKPARRVALIVAETRRVLSPVSAVLDMSWALIAGSATVSFFLSFGNQHFSKYVLLCSAKEIKSNIFEMTG